MSILVKGMDMPKSCFECHLCEKIICFNDANYYCSVLKDEPLILSPYKSKRIDCPLVEVPTPHGRLIDADALEEEADSQPCF